MSSTPIARLGSAALLAMLPVAVHAQTANDGALGFGYVANAPDAIVGGTVWGLIPGLSGWGLYLDVKIDPYDPSADETFMDVTAAQVEVLYPNDQEFEQDEAWRSYNVAVVHSITNELMLYAGAGYAYRDVYRRFLDPQENRGQIGFYWVADPEVSGGGVNFLLGGLLRASRRLRLQFGGETAPVGFTVGASVMLGGW